MHPAGAVVHGELDPRKQENPFFAGGLSQRLEFIPVELVVVGDYPDCYVLFNQTPNVIFAETAFVSVIDEFFVGSRMKVKICPYRLATMSKSRLERKRGIVRDQLPTTIED